MEFKTSITEGHPAIDRLRVICLDHGARSAVLWQEGAVRYRGPEATRRFNAWSCTKSFTSVCCGLLVDEGKLEIDVPATEWLPELRGGYPGVTLRHLLTFTSGLNLDPEDPWALRAPNFAPGRCFHYSQESEWLGLAITRAAGESMASLFQRKVGDAIGMLPGTWDWGRHPEAKDGLCVNGGSGGLGIGVHLNADALLRFGRWMLQGGKWEGRQLVSRGWLDEAQRPQSMGRVEPWDPEGWYRDWLPGTYGLHWWCNGIMRNGRRLWPSAPPETFAAQGNLNQICLVVPAWDTVLVRMGDDGIIDMERYDEVLAAIAPPS